jgi:hypothetical protein
VDARAPSYIQDPRRRRRKMTVEDLLGPQEFQLGKTRRQTFLLMLNDLVVPDHGVEISTHLHNHTNRETKPTAK